MGVQIVLHLLTAAVLIIAFQLMINSIIHELKPNSGETMRDLLNRVELATGELQQAVKRLEDAGKLVATELKNAQGRAVTKVGGEAGEAADAAALPEKN